VRAMLRHSRKREGHVIFPYSWCRVTSSRLSGNLVYRPVPRKELRNPTMGWHVTLLPP
jgi:hypothetical protein